MCLVIKVVWLSLILQLLLYMVSNDIIADVYDINSWIKHELAIATAC